MPKSNRKETLVHINSPFGEAMSVYALIASIWALPEPSVLIFLYSLNEILADLKVFHRGTENMMLASSNLQWLFDLVSCSPRRALC